MKTRQLDVLQPAQDVARVEPAPVAAVQRGRDCAHREGDDVWQLYGPDDWIRTHNLATEGRTKLAELQRLWLIKAVEYKVVGCLAREADDGNTGEGPGRVGT
jgi:hypothetical protein